jgi:hypothetical protein
LKSPSGALRRVDEIEFCRRKNAKGSGAQRMFCVVNLELKLNQLMNHPLEDLGPVCFTGSVVADINLPDCPLTHLKMV